MNWKNNRPPDWKNPYKPERFPNGSKLELSVLKRREEGFEEGADAMFEVLRREGNSKGGRVENDPIRGTGTWLFIPDEKEA